MNKVILMGRLTRDPEVRYSAGENSLAIARYTLAVDRRFKRDGEATADFISCVVFGKQAEFAEKYFRQGKVYTTEVVVEEQEFAESKAVSDSHVNRSASQPAAPDMADSSAEGFMNIPDEIGGELPF